MWKFTQDRWVVRKEVAAVTKVSGFLFFLNQKVVISWLYAAGHCVGVDRGCCCKPFPSQCLLCSPFGTGVDNTLSREKHSEQLPPFPQLQDCPCSWVTGMHRVLSCFSGKQGTVRIELTEGAYTAQSGCSVLGVLRATLLLAFASCNIE